jgi:hypothetical protein
VAKGRPIVVEWAANVRDFLKGTGQVEKSVEDVAKELKDATKESGRFEDRFTADMRKAERSADRAAKNIEDDFARAPGKLGEFGSEAGDEFMQNLGESVSSGDVEGLLAGVAGGLVGGLSGPLAFAAGAIGAVAIGVFQKTKEETERLQEEIKERVDTMFSAFLDGAVNFQGQWDDLQLQERVKDLLDSMSAEEIEEARSAAETLGVPWETMIEAIAGDTDAIALMEEATYKAYQAAQETKDEFTLLPNEISTAATAIDDEVAGAIKYVTDLTDKELNPSLSEFQTKAKALGDYLDGIDGRQVEVTYVLKPGDAFTANQMELMGP